MVVSSDLAVVLVEGGSSVKVAGFSDVTEVVDPSVEVFPSLVAVGSRNVVVSMVEVEIDLEQFCNF